MAPRARRCAGCGGPLPETAPDVTSITCQFCGTVNDLPNAGAGAPVVVNVDIGKAAAQMGRGAKRIMTLVAVVMIIGAGIAIREAAKPITTALNEAQQQIKDVEARTSVPRSPVERKTALAPAGLAAVTGGGWRELEVAPPTGGWNAVDPVGAIEWAREIARAWAPDARLTRVDVARVSAAGIADASSDPDETVGFRFLSPARIAEWEQRAASDLKAEAGYELMLRAGASKVTALVVHGRPPRRDPPAREPDSLALSAVISRAQKSGRFSELPFYAGYLIYNDREGWVWYLNGLARRESMPRLRARDGAVYPYR